MLDNLFRVNFSRAVPLMPALPALFDKMTTHIVSQRFTAEQALKFLNDSAMDVPQDALEAPLELGMEYGAMFDSEVYWSRLPPGLRASWTDYRAPPLPRSFWILNWLIQIPIFRRVIVPGRRFLGI